jgi:hypothetical protein
MLHDQARTEVTTRGEYEGDALPMFRLRSGHETPGNLSSGGRANLRYCPKRLPRLLSSQVLRDSQRGETRARRGIHPLTGLVGRLAIMWGTFASRYHLVRLGCSDLGHQHDTCGCGNQQRT